MASKTISVSEKAYKRLEDRKREKESFTDTINRLTKERPLSEIAGILSEREADELREKVKENRKKSEERLREVAERLKK